MNLATIVVRKTLLDYYLECGFSAHLLSVSALLFFGFLWAAVGNPRVFHRFLMPATMLPLAIGIFGCASSYYAGLRSMRLISISISESAFEAFSHWEEGVLPVMAGSFLTMLFIVISLVFQFIHRRLLAGLNDGS